MGLLHIEHASLFDEISHESSQLEELRKITSGSGKMLSWLCNKNHIFQARVFNRVKGSGCPYCSGLLALENVNDLKTLFPEIFNFIVDKKVVILPFSSKKILFECKNGHQKLVSPKYFCERGSFFCNNCSVEPVLSVFNSFLKNSFSTLNSVSSDSISVNSHKKFLWHCEKGHEWEATPHSRYRGRGCPLCAGRTDKFLTETHPLLLKEWFSDDISPEDFTYGSTRLVTWKCDKGHVFERSINKRTYPDGKFKACPVCANKIVVPGINDAKTTHPDSFNFLMNKRSIDNKSYGSESYVQMKCEEGHEWETQIRSLSIYKSGCPKCATSQGEKEISMLFRNFPVKTSFNDRKTIAPYELDIFFPEKDIAIEFNGIYWHSEKMGKKRSYHYDKWKACKDKGIQLIQIWEDDWLYNSTVVTKMLLHKLNLDASEDKVYARNTNIIELSNGEALEFFESNHIQGANIKASIKLGLKDNDGNIVAGMILKKDSSDEQLTYQLVRYATSKTTVGGFTKLLTYVERIYNPKSIYTFSDNCVSNGLLYSNNGFLKDKDIAPDYMYVVNKKRIHKFNYRLKRFRTDEALFYKKGLTEHQLADLNNIPRIWDAGKIRWVKYYS